MKKSKKIVSTVLAFGLAAASLTGCGGGEAKEEKAPEETNKKVTMWVYQEDMQKVVDEFEKTHKDIDVEVVIVSYQDYAQKLQTALASEAGIPDIVTMNGGVADEISAFDIYEDLEQAPYNFDKTLVSDAYWPKMSNAEGKIIGVAAEQAFAGLAYRKEPVKELLGTDDPKELEAMLPDWESFIEVGKKVKEETGGKTYMFSSLGEVGQIVSKQIEQPFVDGKTVTLSGEYKEKALDTVLAMRDAGISDRLSFGSAAWVASFASDEYLFRFAPLWSPEWWFHQNDPEGDGKWGLMNIPEGAVASGGGTYCITKACQNKEAAWEFLEWMLLSKEGAEVTRDIFGWSVAYQKAYEDPEYKVMTNPSFGETNIGEKYFDEIMPNVITYPVNVYDSDIMGAYETALEVISKDDSVDSDGFLDVLTEELKLKNAELEVK